jgi:Cu(I)/Ag(I) efflux system membrane fusion protein
MQLVRQGGATATVLEISPARQQLIGVRLEKVASRSMRKTIVASGIVAIDETSYVDLFAETGGTVEQVLGNPVGQFVRRGEPLYTVVSGGEKKLLRAPVTGHIVWRVTYGNAALNPKSKVGTFSDHSKLWVWVEIYETDLLRVRPGQAAKMSVPAHAGRVFAGTIALVSPILQTDTHTVRCRIDVRNEDYALKPGMSAVVELESDLGVRVAIPESSVIRTGTENIVFVAAGEGRFDVRDVRLGQPVGGFYEVIDGLAEGEEIVTTANFLIDAESKLQGIRSSWRRD